MLRNTYPSLKILSHYKYIFCDEFQDMSNTLYWIFMEFVKQGAILTVAGDHTQNIYEFRGTDNKFLLFELENSLSYINNHNKL